VVWLEFRTEQRGTIALYSDVPGRYEGHSGRSFFLGFSLGKCWDRKLKWYMSTYFHVILNSLFADILPFGAMRLIRSNINR